MVHSVILLAVPETRAISSLSLHDALPICSCRSFSVRRNVFEDRQDPVDRIVSHLRRPVQIDPALDGRVMQEIADGETGRRPGAAVVAWRWLIQPRQLAVSPLGALATAAGLAALVWALPGRGARPAPAEAASRRFSSSVSPRPRPAWRAA